LYAAFGAVKADHQPAFGRKLGRFFSLGLHLLRGAVLLVNQDRKNIADLVRLDIGKEGLILAILLTPQFQRKWQQQQDQQNEKGFLVSHICTSSFSDFSGVDRHGGAVNDTGKDYFP